MPEEKLGYCPCCGVTLGAREEISERAVQVMCRCRKVKIPQTEIMKSGSLRKAWEKAVGWRG